MPAPPLPQHCPTPRELDDLELIVHGVLDLRGFEGEHGLVTLVVPPTVASAAADAGGLELIDPEGLPLARLDVGASYAAEHGVGIQGPVTPLSHPEVGVFRRLKLAPQQVADQYDADAVTVPVSAPLTDRDLEHIVTSARGRPVLLLALTGTGTPEPDEAGLVRATLAAVKHLSGAGVVAVPLASRGNAEADQLLRARVVTAYAPGGPDSILRVAGEGAVPDDIATAARPGNRVPGLVVFFTGLSGSGKSTLARALHDRVLEAGRRTVTSLDGDVVRRHLSAGLGFSREDRETNIARIGWVAAEIARHGGVAICSPIAPFGATRKRVRAMVEDAGGRFVLVHVATPLAECERRDRKGLYARARRGEIPDFTGISSPYEEPADAAVRVDTTGRSVEDVLAEVVAILPPGVVDPPGGGTCRDHSTGEELDDWSES